MKRETRWDKHDHCGQHAQYDADSEVIGGHRADHGDDHDRGLRFRHKAQRGGADRVPAKGCLDTKIITASSAAIGIIATMSPRLTDNTRMSTPAVKVEMRVRACEALTLIIVWPTMAQPPMPPKKPVTILAIL